MKSEQMEDERMFQDTWTDAEGKPVMGENGFVIRIREMAKNQVISERYYDAEMNPVALAGETYHRVDYTYDKLGNINREKYYDTDDNPIRCAAGYAIIYREYDAAGHVVYEKYYDTDGFAIMLEDGAVSRRYEYDDSGNVTKVTKYDYFDKEVP